MAPDCCFSLLCVNGALAAAETVTTFVCVELPSVIVNSKTNVVRFVTAGTSARATAAVGLVIRTAGATP